MSAVLDDDELRRWVEEGRTQTWVAEKVGCTQGAVSKRCRRLGLASSSKRGRPRNIPRNNSKPEPPTNPQFIAWVDRQIGAALHVGRITPRSAPVWRAKLEGDPGPTAKTLASLAAIPSVAQRNRAEAEAMAA